MHILRPQFAWDPEGALDFAASRGFGLFVAAGQTGPVGSHLPFTLARTGDTVTVHFHLAANNELGRYADGKTRMMLAVWGPDAYVSNDFYATPDHVSTWLYEAVHLSGIAHAREPEHNRSHGDQLLERFEADLLPKRPWKLDDMEPTKREAMLRGILVIEMSVDKVEGQRKLNQHKSEAEYASVINHLSKGQEPSARAIASKMLDLRPHLEPRLGVGADHGKDRDGLPVRHKPPRTSGHEPAQQQDAKAEDGSNAKPQAPDMSDAVNYQTQQRGAS
jgi:transcriptional regulator